jgi:acetyltransferase-like isoleucine patch superfamily enzyme
MTLPLTTSSDPRVTVGSWTYGHPLFHLWDDSERIVIGKFCSIGAEVSIFGGGEHRTDWITTYPLRVALGDPLAGRDGHPTTKGATVIGCDVWLGFGSIILSGVNIGHGAVVGAGSVVSRDIPPYAVAVGNPATVKTYRFSDFDIARLLQLEWWNWPDLEIKSIAGLLCSSDLNELFKHATRRS